MAIANLVARLEARYTKFDTRKTVRLTERAEKLALTNDERTVLLAFDDARQAAQEAQVEFTPTEEAVKQAEVIKAKLTKAEKAAKAAEKAIKTREIKVARRKARIAAVRHYLKYRTISTTTIEPDGTEETIFEPVPVEVQEGVEDWKRLGKKVAGFFTYPTDTFRRMWNWAKQPTKHIPAWRRPPRVLRMAVTAAAIAVLAVPVYVIDFAVNAISSLAMIAGGIALAAVYGLSLVVGLVAGLIAKIPFVGKWIALAINTIAGGVAILATFAYAALAVVLTVASLLVKAAINGVLWLLASPWYVAAKIQARKAPKDAEVEAVAEAMAEVLIEAVVDAMTEPVAQPVVEEPVLEGKIIEPEPQPQPKPRPARRKRPAARPNVAVA